MYSGFVQMLPNELFLQITNLDSDIAFAGNIKVELINECQEVVLDITDSFFIDEFTDIKGIKQIAFEFGNIGIDFHLELLHLKISHTVSDAVWYSTAFLITDNLKEETTRFDYKNESYFKGISYDRANYFQSIRLTCFKNDIDVSSEGNEYTQLSGKIISLRKIITNIDKYKFYVCDFFTFSRLVILLTHDLIYINSQRISNKPQPSKGDRVVDSNFFELDFEANPTEEKRTFATQLNIIIPLCEATVSGITATLSNGKMNINWTNSGIPFDVVIEINNELDLTWRKPSGLVLGIVKNSATYNDPRISHNIRITPKCYENSFGTASIFFYENITPIVCVIPTLESVTKDPTNTNVTYVWNNNTFNYLLGTAKLQYSLNFGTSWIELSTATASALTATASIEGVVLGTLIKYRIICSGNSCDNQISNVITTTFGDAVTTLPLYAFHYEGIYTDPDDAHPNGGTVVYKDENNITQYSTFLWTGECRLIMANSIISHVGAVTCVPETHAIWDISSYGYLVQSSSCVLSLDSLIYSAPVNLASVTQFYSNPELTIPYIGDGDYYHIREGAISYTIHINSAGNASSLMAC